MTTLSNTLSSNSSTKTIMAKKVNSGTRKAAVGWIRSLIREQQVIAAPIVMGTCFRLAPILRLQLSAAAPRISWPFTTSRHSTTTASIRTTALVMPVAHDPAPRLTKIVTWTTIRVRRNCQYRQWPTTWRCNFTTALGRTTSIIWRQLITSPKSTSLAEHECAFDSENVQLRLVALFINLDKYSYKISYVYQSFVALNSNLPKCSYKFACKIYN